MKNVIEALEQEIEKQEQQLSEMKQCLVRFRGFSVVVPSVSANGDEPPSTKYKGMKVGAAVHQFMKIHNIATQSEIVSALTRGGMEWGKYPKRQVALAIANNPDRYVEKGDSVLLKE